MAVQVLSGQVFLVITGASKGIGEQIAVTFGHLLTEGSQIVLLARNLEGLKKTASKLPKHLKVNYESIDLSVATADVLTELLSKYLGAEGVKKLDRAVLVHNAASAGDPSKRTVDMTDLEEMRKYLDLNVSSPVVLNGVFMKMFNDESKLERLVINVTSGAAVLPIASLGPYCAGKAAREMFFKVFALEFPQVNVLNYSPGPVDTDMLNAIVATSVSEDLRAKIGGMQIDNKILTTEQTVERLVAVLREQKYKSGDHVDYYDEL